MQLNVGSNLLGRWNLTSTIDWCEPNYVSSPFIAEMWNTFSNLAYMILTGIYMGQVVKFFKTNKTTQKMYMPKLMVDAFGSFFVGVGSFLFHMTLMREFQALDELAMLFTIITHLYCLSTMDDEMQDDRKSNYQFLRLGGTFASVKSGIAALSCIGLFILALIVYEFMIPVVFQGLFGCIVVIALISSFRATFTKHKVNSKAEEETLRIMRRNKLILILLVILCSAIGFTAWNIDNQCNYEHLKLHSIWHLFTAYASYVWGIFVLYAHWSEHYARMISGESNAPRSILVSFAWGFLPRLDVKVVENPNHKSQDKKNE